MRRNRTQPDQETHPEPALLDDFCQARIVEGFLDEAVGAGAAGVAEHAGLLVDLSIPEIEALRGES